MDRPKSCDFGYTGRVCSATLRYYHDPVAPPPPEKPPPLAKPPPEYPPPYPRVRNPPKPRRRRWYRPLVRKAYSTMPRMLKTTHQKAQAQPSVPCCMKDKMLKNARAITASHRTT